MDRIDPPVLNGSLSRLKTRGAAPVSRVETTRASAEGGAKPGVVTTAVTASSAGAEPPVDTGRVAEIRKAVEQGRYPVVPTKIADAMIAAGFLLRTRG
ncbi:flagellar biosynthesis anti-sigma factor FlgM [Croceibacterium aestuarii]|uniref:flagellar biosynthesis anti-sigma factor FlgM n=1 Tax=Croceibacterium aestuarii TaxID=3064139 RepID=UPI00272E1028|nr:flagellar biosynthesis anti-sigma factor FlgM [Croceibacterium sp. D39]